MQPTQILLSTLVLLTLQKVECEYTVPVTTKEAGSHGYQVWHSIPRSTAWSIVFAAVPPNLDLTNAPQQPLRETYTWKFAESPGSPNLIDLPCTLGGIPNQSPCQGRVVELTFQQPGTYAVECTVTRPNDTPLLLSITITVPQNTNIQPTRRHEFRDISMFDWSRFVAGAKALKALQVWDHMALIHAMTFQSATPGSSRTSAHSSPAFLTWHRVYIYNFENLFQSVLNDPTFAIPFWDWTLDSMFTGYTNRETLSQQLDSVYPATHPNLNWLKSFTPSPSSPIPVFTDQYMGPNGDPSANDAVRSGPFCSRRLFNCTSYWEFGSEYGLGTTVIQRKLGLDDGARLPTAEQVGRMQNLTQYDVPPFESRFPPPFAQNQYLGFRAAVEGWAGGPFGGMHNGVHRWVGGTMMNVQFSIFDPVFLLHHNNVERQFAQWQLRHGCSDPSCFRPTQADLLRTLPAEQIVNTPERELTMQGHMFEDSLRPWRVTHSMVWNNVFTVYQEPGTPASPAPPVSTTTTGATTSSSTGTLTSPPPSNSRATASSSTEAPTSPASSSNSNVTKSSRSNEFSIHGVETYFIAFGLTASQFLLFFGV